MPVKIYPAAQARIFEIWEYTERTWGEEQADSYVRELGAAAERAIHERHLWRPVGDKELVNVFFVRHRHHYIFFRELSDGSLGVISILHGSMDLPARLKEDVEDEGSRR